MPALANLTSLRPNDRFQGELLVLDRAERKTNSGDPFLILTLGNPSGRIETAPIWSDKLEWADGVAKGTFVQAIGDVSVFNDKRQLKLASPLRVLPDGHYRTEDFLESVGDVSKLWEWIDRNRAMMGSTTLRRVVDLFFGDDTFRAQFERTPGSISRHHSKVGGLLLHVYEVASIARSAARTMRVNVDLVFAGALLHDIGKVDSYEITRGGFGYTPCGLLVGHVVLGVLMLERRLASIGEAVCTEGQLLELQHMILSHHGALQFGAPVEPMTAEAELLHWADEASAKGDDMVAAIRDDSLFDDAETGGMSQRRAWRVGRSVFRRSHDWD